MFSRIIFLTILIFAGVTLDSRAQTNISSQSNAADASKATSRERSRDDSPPSQNMLEMRERWRMEAEEKDHRERLERSDRAARLSLDLNKSFASNNQLLTADNAKLTDLEKLVRKIRKSLGGDDDKDEIEDEPKPATLSDALAKLSETGATLNDELKKSSRHELSADAINKSNEILDLITLIRSFSGLK